MCTALLAVVALIVTLADRLPPQPSPHCNEWNGEAQRQFPEWDAPRLTPVTTRILVEA
jgi:hypothetical protein